MYGWPKTLITIVKKKEKANEKIEQISIIIIRIISIITIGFFVFSQIQNYKLQEKLLKENNQLKE